MMMLSRVITGSVFSTCAGDVNENNNGNMIYVIFFIVQDSGYKVRLF